MKHSNVFSLVVSLLLLTAASCTSTYYPGDGIRTDYIVFGRFAGECLGEQCVEIFKIEDQALFEDTLDDYPSTLYTGSFVQLSNTQYNKVSHILAAVPHDIFSLPDGIVGQPDTYDQGGIYVELEKDGKSHSWRIDTAKESIPEFLHAFVDSVQAAVEKLQ